MNEPVIIGGARLLNCDCMELMRDIPDKYYQLAISDPPYGIGFDGEIAAMVSHGIDTRWKNRRGNGYERKEWDKCAPDDLYFAELMRVSKNQIVWGGNYFELPQSSGWIFWDKGVAEKFTLSPGELAWTSFKKSVAKVSILWAGFRKCEPEQRIHPTQKPVKLYEWLLTNYAKPGDRILDTHLGSMSSVIACLKMGYEITGCELDKDYFQAGVQRVRDSQRQETLFTPMIENKAMQGVIV